MIFKKEIDKKHFIIFSLIFSGIIFFIFQMSIFPEIHTIKVINGIPPSSTDFFYEPRMQLSETFYLVGFPAIAGFVVTVLIFLMVKFLEKSNKIKSKRVFLYILLIIILSIVISIPVRNITLDTLGAEAEPTSVGIKVNKINPNTSYDISTAKAMGIRLNQQCLLGSYVDESIRKFNWDGEEYQIRFIGNKIEVLDSGGFEVINYHLNENYPYISQMTCMPKKSSDGNPYLIIYLDLRPTSYLELLLIFDKKELLYEELINHSSRY